MSQPEIVQSVNRTEAFRRAKAENKNHEAAGAAFLAELPILSGPVAFQAYFACLGQALTLGVIDLVDLGRYCHLARMAMSAWKLAHPALPSAKKTAPPTPPKGNHFALEETSLLSPQPFGDPENSLPTPTKGNLSEEEANRYAAANLPRIEMQHAIFKLLRKNGVSLPSNSHLRKNPMKALYYCALAKDYVNDLPSDSSQPAQAAA